MPLTDPACKNATCPPDKARVRLTDAGGLYLEVTPAGAKLWRWKYRLGPKEKRLALGSYPDVSLSQARSDRDAARLLLRSGTDPVQARKDEKLANRLKLDHSFESVARAWHETWKQGKSTRHADYVIRRLELDVFPAIGGKPIAEVTAPTLIAVAKKVERRGALDIAHRLWQSCGQVFEYAVAHGMVTRNPTRDIRPGAALKAPQKESFARLAAKDMPELLRKMAAYQGSVHTRYALDLIARTFVRTGELIGARWEEFDLDAAEWRIPAGRTKMRTPHIVPLSTQAVDALRCLHEIKGIGPFVFPGERDHESHMSNGAILGALKRMGYAGRMTGHGFRGVASTILHEHGFDHVHIELQLAHQERNKVSAAYNFATYLPARRKMMQWYSDHLDQLRQGAKVIPFKAA
ncbi:tyrosine-type recombinase/integrase [Rubrivivax albus]|uniref:DUF4102 domain-containing protein n=1 Tax=Rubrivivax albus TaxID=2499835 RepID=A0A437JNN3_9BURK|nr:integrase arm-type DNA-binding domain-containing protein [Rubrivivax albus]RVT48379.1 DUF4102 domain-containing protein [Rubrivivax albus]